MPGTWQKTGFSEQQWNALQSLIGGIRATRVPNRWNAAEIGFFDPYYGDKIAGTAPAVHHKAIKSRNLGSATLDSSTPKGRWEGSSEQVS